MQIYLYKNNQQYGPYEETAVIDSLRNGQCSLTDLAIREGMSEWQPLWAVIQLPTGSGNLETEYSLFEAYGELLDSMSYKTRQGDAQTAFRQWEQMLQILENQVRVLKAQFPDADEVQVMECYYFGNCAGLELFRKNMSAALDLFDRSIAVMDTPGAHLVKASIYHTLNRRSEAVRELDWVIATFPDQEQEYQDARQLRAQI